MKFAYYKKNPKIRICLENDADVPDDYTVAEPIGVQFYPYIAKQTPDQYGGWRLIDTSADRAILDSMVKIPALDIIDALADMDSKLGNEGKTIEDDLYDLFTSEPALERRWNIAPDNIIDTNDNRVQNVLTALNVKIDDIRRKILELKGLV